jgi:hypothetical protein
MPLKPLKFRPGVNRDATNYSGEGGWWEMDKVRFLSGYPQKIGGWVKATPFSFLGTCRFMWNWITTFRDNFLAIGTNLKLYLEAGGNFYDITPIQGISGTGDITFTAVNGSSSITVVDVTSAPTYTLIAGNYVTFSGATALGGNVTATIINSTHEIQTVANTTTYTIIVSVVANASDSGNGGASVVGEYDINSGNAGDEFGYGWGTSTWSRNAWGLGSEAPILLPPRTWWYDNFDNDLVANIEGGSIYYWERGSNTNPATAIGTRAELMEDIAGATDVPVKVMQVLISQQDKHLLACGSVPYGSSSADDFDPLLIRWTNQDDPFNWTPSPTNSAGFIKVSRGSRIVRAIPTRQEVLIFTDSHLYTLQFTGTTDVFNLQEYAENISIAGARAVISANNVTFWMGRDKFYTYTGRVETLPTTLRQHVFGDINLNAGYQIIAGTNEGWNEVWWIYPSSTSNAPNKYVIFNYNEKIWYYGNIDRTGWIDSPLRDSPLAVQTPLGSETGFLYFQENGVNDDLLPMDSYILSNDFDIEDGDKFMLTKRIIPDINFTGSTASTPEVQLQIRPTNFPGTPSSNNEERPVIQTSVGNYTDQVFIRARSRQMGFKVGSTDLGVQWQLGTPRLDARQDGKR